MTVRFNISADLFRNAFRFRSTEETRYYFCGVHLEPHPVKGVILVATDGHSMFVAHDAEGHVDEPMILAMDKKDAKTIGKRSRTCTDGPYRLTGLMGAAPVGVRANGADIVDATGNFVAGSLAWRIDGTFPDWRRLMPHVTKGNSDEPMSFPAELQAKLSATCLDLYQSDLTGGAKAYSIAGEGVMSPRLVTFMRCDVAFAVAMPARAPASPQLPAFMRHPAPGGEAINDPASITAEVANPAASDA